MTFEEDSKFEWREKYEEDRDVEEYKTTTMKELGLTKARSSVINLKKFGSNRISRSGIVCLAQTSKISLIFQAYFIKTTELKYFKFDFNV